MKDKIKVIITDDQNSVKLPRGVRMLIRRCCNAVLTNEQFKGSAEISVTIVDDEAIHELNLKHRGMDKPTDVLSFPQVNYDEGEELMEGDMLGDIVLSLERAREQAAEFGHSFERECAFLCAHSTLHLLGYDHELSDEDDADMRRRQSEIMEKMGLSIK